MSTSIGTVGVRVVPNLSGFGASVSSAVAGAGGATMARAGAASALLFTAPFVATVAKSLGSAIEFESGLAGVNKTVSATPKQLELIGSATREMAKELPYTTAQLLTMAEAVGRFGVDAENIPMVTEMFSKLGTAIPEMDATTAAEQMVRFFNVMKTGEGDWEKYLSSLVALGNDTATSEQQIVSFASRLAQVSAVSNVTEADVLGLAAGFSALNIRPMAGASSISRVFFEMSEAVNGNQKTMKTFTDTMGLTNDEFTRMFNQDPANLFLDLLEDLKAVQDEGGNVTDVLDALKINDIRVRRAILSGMNAPEGLREALSLATSSADDNTALEEEFGKRAETTAAKWQVLKNKANDVAITLGIALIPALLDLFDALEPVIEVMAGMANVFAALDPDLQKMIVAVLTIIAVLGPLVFIGSKVAIMLQGVGAAFAALAANPVVLILIAIAAVAYLIYKNWDTLKKWFSEFWDWLKEKATATADWIKDVWGGAKEKFEEIWGGVRTFLTDTWNGIRDTAQEVWDTITGIITGAIEGVVNFFREWWRLLIILMLGPMGVIINLLIVHWDTIKHVFSVALDAITDYLTFVFNWWKDEVIMPVWDAITAFFSTAWEAIKVVFQLALDAIGVMIDIALIAWRELIEPALNTLQTVFDNVWTGIKWAVETAIDAIEQVLSYTLTPAIDAAKTAIEFLQVAWDVAWSGITTAVQVARDLIVGAIREIKQAAEDALGPLGNVLSNAGSGLGWALGQGKTLIGKAGGGAVMPGQDYLVGEQGPELVRFGARGTVIPAAQTAAMLGGGGGGTRTVNFNLNGPVSVRNDDDILAMRRAFYEQEEREARARGEVVVG